MSLKNITKKLFSSKLFWIFVFAFLFRFGLSFLTHHPDLNNHGDWGIRFWQYGASGFFAPDANVWSFIWPNQPPGTMYMFAGARKIYEGVFGALSYLHFNLHIFPGSILLYLELNLYTALLKLPAILSDLGIAYLIYKIVLGLVKDEKKGKKLATIGAVVFLFNPLVWYNSVVWGQYDSVINFLALLSFYFLMKRRLGYSVIAFALSLYVKASLLIFAPIFLVAALGQKYKFKEYLSAIFLGLFVIGTITLPFSQGEPFSWLFNLYKERVFVDQLHTINANAFNLWGAVNGIHAAPHLYPEITPLLGLTYQYWGYIIFAIFYLPVLWIAYKKHDSQSVIWALAGGAFSAFMLLTNMHERYLYPLFPYFTILLIMVPELYANFAAVSIINLLNLYNFWFTPFIWSLVGFMEAKDNLVPRVLSGISFALFIFFYMRFVRYNFLRKSNE